MVKLLFYLLLFAYSSDSLDELSYVETGTTEKRSILFVHGTPGSSEAYKIYYEDENLQKLFHMVSIDRLGFGSSSKKSEASLEVHAESILKLLVEHWPNKKFNCLGHSYGVPVCLKLFLMKPEMFEKGVLLAGAVNPNRRILRWYNYAAGTWFVRLFLSRGLKNSNDEMKGLKGELFKLEKELVKIDKDILIIHGQKDQIVPFEDSVYLREGLVNSRLKVFSPENMGHLFLWKEKGYLEEKIINFL